MVAERRESTVLFGAEATSPEDDPLWRDCSLTVFAEAASAASSAFLFLVPVGDVDNELRFCWQAGDASAVTSADPSSSTSPDSSDAPLDAPIIPAEDNPTTDPSPPAQDNGPATEVVSWPEPSITAPDGPTIPAEDNPTIDPSPPAQDTGSNTGPNSSNPEPDSPSGSSGLPTTNEIPAITDGPTAGTTTAPVSTITVSVLTPTTDPASVAGDSSTVESVPATVVQPTPPTVEPSVVAPVPLTEVPVPVPIVPVAAAAAPPGILQWLVLLTWFQLQWLMQWQQQLNGTNATPVVNRFGDRDTRLVSAMFENSVTTAFFAKQFAWLKPTLGALRAMPRVDLATDHALLHEFSMTLGAETASLPAIAEAVTNQVHSPLRFPTGNPCVSTFVRTVSVWALFTAAALGLFGLISMTGLGVTVGFRQAKAGFAVQACGYARFTRPGPLGVVREAGIVSLRTPRSSAGPPLLRVVGTDVRDTA
ncbi:hypothetical protein ACTWP6_18975 [Mycobacterium sp. 4D054]|uniref:hypothetical protein n=1 Tax=Mycobacterium sp. 4D054 TaxID=3457440 RepID=UPI003FCFC60A